MAAGTTDVPWSLHAIIATIVDKLVWFCALLPYGVIALLARIVMARVFFLAGQDKISGPRIPLNVSLPGSDLTLLDMSVILPAEIKDSTVQLFETHYAYSPVSGAVAAYLVAYAGLSRRYAWSSVLRRVLPHSHCLRSRCCCKSMLHPPCGGRTTSIGSVFCWSLLRWDRVPPPSTRCCAISTSAGRAS